MFAVLTGRTEVLKWILETAKNTENVPDGGILKDKNRMVTLAIIWWDVWLEGGEGGRKAGEVYSDIFVCHSDFTRRTWNVCPDWNGIQYVPRLCGPRLRCRHTLPCQWVAIASPSLLCWEGRALDYDKQYLVFY